MTMSEFLDFKDDLQPFEITNTLRIDSIPHATVLQFLAHLKTNSKGIVLIFGMAKYSNS